MPWAGGSTNSCWVGGHGGGASDGKEIEVIGGGRVSRLTLNPNFVSWSSYQKRPRSPWVKPAGLAGFVSPRSTVFRPVSIARSRRPLSSVTLGGSENSGWKRGPNAVWIS